MTCFICGKGNLIARLARVDGVVKREKFTVETNALICDACGHVALEGGDLPEYMRMVADAYRTAHNLLTSREIRRIRGHMSQRRFAAETGLGVATVKRAELGLIQDKKTNKLILDFANRARPKWTPYEFEQSPEELARCTLAAGVGGLPHGPPCGPSGAICPHAP